MPKSIIQEDYRPVKLNFINIPNLVVIQTIGDGNCYFHSVLRAFNTSYIKAGAHFDRINLARTFRNALADRLIETDPLTGSDYYSGLNNGRLEDISQGVKEYTKDALRKELLSSQPVDNIYQELISNSVNKDIYIIDGETMDMYNTGSAFSLYYKGRNSIIIIYTPGHFETVGIRRSDGTIDTIFTPEHPLIQSCRERLINEIRVDRKKEVFTPRASSPRVTSLRASSPVRR
jgi:hypothetical protein